MLTKQLNDELNEQIKFEFYSSHLYLAAASYAYQQDLDGFANFFIVQAEEEKFHAMKIFNFINEMDGVVVMQSFDTPKADYKNIVDLFEFTFAHEKIVTERIYHLMDIATQDKEYATRSFLQWFIDEQVEEMSTFKSMVQKLKRGGDDPAILYAMDDLLAQRTFTPPAN